MYNTEEEAQAIIHSASKALGRLVSLMKDAQTATTKEQAEVFIKEIELADFQALKALAPDEELQKRNIKEFIRNGEGDFGRLKELYVSLGAV